MKSKKNILFVCLSAVIISFYSCKNNPLDVELPEKAHFKPTIVRLDERIWNCPEANFGRLIDSIKKSDIGFYKGWVSQIIYSQNFRFNPALEFDSLKHLFYYNTPMRNLMAVIHEKFGNNPEIEEKASMVYNYYNHHFPNNKLPVLITTVNGLRAYGAVFENSISISLDHFLGEKHPVYFAVLDLPQYIISKFSTEYFGKRVAEALYDFNDTNTANPPLEFRQRMVYEGIHEYYIDAMMPNSHDSIKREFSVKQLEWLKTNEKQIWEHFASQNLFYKTDPAKYNRYFENGPFTPGLFKETSPRMAVWVGYNIVKKYMETHPKVSLSQLLAERDYSKIFTESGYKP